MTNPNRPNYNKVSHLIKEKTAAAVTSLRKRIEEEQEQPPNETIFFNGSDHFNSLIKDIDNALSSIDLETYIFQRDRLGDRIVEALINAAQRGIKIRLLVDGAGTPYWGGGYARKLERAGIQTRVFHPFPWQFWNWSRSVVKFPAVLKWLYLFLTVNSRNHRKVCIIDHKITYIGSTNITISHLPKKYGGNGWRDTTVRITNLDTNTLEKAFESAWSQGSIKERLREIFKHIRKDPIIRLNYTRHRRRILFKNLLRKMKLCKNRIWITNAYFIPDNFLLRTLREAAKNNIDVRILLPKKSDVMLMPWASSTFYYNLLKVGVRIFEYLPSNLHAKSLILDDWMLIGSSNLNHRSLLHDLEVDVNIRNPKSKEKIVNQFLEDLKHSKEILFDSWKENRPWFQRALGRLSLYLKYWI